mmetsp:Transcript_21187/g.56513  ORF Transcript_21187/g.56513 Transcript_21187/m.56513 type:complete len:225 (-) Transcript_21187:100-774(-)
MAGDGGPAVSLRIFYIHGLESNAQGFKATYLKKWFPHVCAVEMDTSSALNLGGTVERLSSERSGDGQAHKYETADKFDHDVFEHCIEQQADALRRFAPDVVVGSSFGGAVAVEILLRGLWSGPTVLLAPAHQLLSRDFVIPPSIAVTVIHGLRDSVVPLGSSVRLASCSRDVVLVTPDDTHGLRTMLGVKSDTLGALPASFELRHLIRDCFERHARLTKSQSKL